MTTPTSSIVSPTTVAPGPASPARASRVLAVALMKSGTHLLQELLIAMGYRIAGVPRIPQHARVQLTVDDAARLWRGLAPSAPGNLEPLPSGRPEVEEPELWTSVQDQVQLQLGAPLARHYGRERTDAGRVPGATYLPFDATPGDVAWIVSELDPLRVDGSFWNEWVTTGEPRTVFLFRDPRACTLSMVNFLLDANGNGFGDYEDFRVFHELLRGLGSMDERLEFALTCPGFPGQRDHARMRWMLYHPRVFSTSYEALVGPEGGGAATDKAGAIAGVRHHLGVTEIHSTSIYNRNSFTFHVGDVDSWRQAYSPRNLALADRVFSDDLRAYGYEG